MPPELNHGSVEDLVAATPAAKAYRASLPPGRLIAFPLAGLDRLGVPAWCAVYLDGAEEVDGGGGVVQHGVGYGATDAEALVGAMGELAEFAHSYRALQAAPRRVASWAELHGELGSRGVVDPLELCLPAGSPVGGSMQLEWVEAKRYATGETVLVPIDAVAAFGTDLTPSYEPFTTPISNGMGAGPSLGWALAHGLQELLQRDGNGLGFRALDQGVVLDGLEGAVNDPATSALLDRFAAAGIEVLPKFASDEFGVANLYVVGRDHGPETPLSLMTTACGEAASPDRGRALRKALLEFGAARARKCFMHGPLDLIAEAATEYLARFRPRHSLAWEESRALQATLGWLALSREELTAVVADTVLAKRSTKPFSELPTWAPAAGADGDVPGKALCDELARRLGDAGLDVLYVDLSPPNAAEIGVHAVKAIVPGLEVETMSYLRIGERGARKLLDRGGDLVGPGEPPPGCLPVRLTAAAMERLGGPVWLDPAAVDRAVGRLYPLYREPEYHSCQIVLEARAKGLAA